MREKRGFTLTEIIVILVILAILAAVLLPALTTYVEKARQQTVLARARAVYVATQTLLSQWYGEAAGFDGCEEPVELVIDSLRPADTPIKLEDILELAQLPLTLPAKLTIAYNAQATLTQFIWQEQLNGRTVTVTRSAGVWETALF